MEGVKFRATGFLKQGVDLGEMYLCSKYLRRDTPRKKEKINLDFFLQ
jgi:hypothetical protein